MIFLWWFVYTYVFDFVNPLFEFRIASQLFAPVNSGENLDKHRFPGHRPYMPSRLASAPTQA